MGQRRSLACAAARVLLAAVILHCAAVCVFGLDVRLAPTLTDARPRALWLFLPLGYLLTVAVETPVLLGGLSQGLSFRQRLFAGLWLTACTYPIVVLVLPVLFADAARASYLLVAETFAPVAECALFWLAFRRTHAALPWARNFAVIVLANLLSFAAGEWLNTTRWFGLF